MTKWYRKLYDHKPKPHLHAFAIALCPLRTLTHCDCRGCSSDSAGAATPDAKATRDAMLRLPPPVKIDVESIWSPIRYPSERPRIVFDCRMANDPAVINKGSTNENNTDVDRWADARRLRINGKPCSKKRPAHFAGSRWHYCRRHNMRLPLTIDSGHSQKR